MNEIERIVEEVSASDELLEAFKAIAQPRTDYQLEHFVVGKHETKEQQYAHCVLELKVKYHALRLAKISLERIDYEIGVCNKKAEGGDKLAEFDAREKEIGREECELAVLGAIREFSTLYKLWKGFDKKYTREDINATTPLYWQRRVEQQANDDLMASGRITVGNLQALRQIGKGVTPELDHVRDIEQKYIENGNMKIMIAVPTEEKAITGLPCINELIIPSGMQVKYYNCYGRKIASAYNDIAMTFLRDGADYLMTVEDDTFPPPDALVRLLEHIKQGKKAVGAWYPKRQGVYEGVPIVLKDNKRGSLDADGEVHEVYTLPMGCSLYSAEVFYRINFPYFATTECLTQDSFFSQKIREAGIKMYVDTSILCKHVDRNSGKVYQYQEGDNGNGKSAFSKTIDKIERG